MPDGSLRSSRDSVPSVCRMRPTASRCVMRCRSSATVVLHKYAPILVGEVYALRLAVDRSPSILSAGSPVVGFVNATIECQVAAAYARSVLLDRLLAAGGVTPRTMAEIAARATNRSLLIARLQRLSRLTSLT